MSYLEDIETYSETSYLEPFLEILPGEVGHEIIGSFENNEINFNMEVVEDIEVIGTPEQDSELWHLQEHPMSCAVVCQEFVAEGLLKEDYSEEKMRTYASKHEWFDDNGTCLKDTGNLLEAMGIEVERSFNCTTESIREVLQNDGKVIVGVNNAVLENPLYAKLPGFQANHAVQVIGIDESNPEDIQVILNDPGVMDGGGIRHSLNTFETAWKKSNCFMMSAYLPEGEIAK